MLAVNKWCAALVCTLALSGCVPLAVGTAAGAALGAGLGAVKERNSIRGGGRDVGAAVDIRFSQPRDVYAVRRTDGRSAPKDSIRVPGVTSVLGRIADQRNDSLEILLSGTSGARGRTSFGNKHVLTIARDTSVTMKILNRNPSRNTGLLFGAVAGWFVAGILALRAALGGT